MNHADQIDWTDSRTAEKQLLELEKAVTRDIGGLFIKLRERLGDDCEQFFDLLNTDRRREWLIGARLALKRSRLAAPFGNPSEAATEIRALKLAQAAVQRQLETAQHDLIAARKALAGRITALENNFQQAQKSTRATRLYELDLDNCRQNRQNSRLRGKLTDLRILLEIAEGRSIAADPDEFSPGELPVPEWRPNAGVARPVSPDELPTNVPTIVRDVARRVEDYLGKHPTGCMSKPEVSAAFPDCRPYLGEAYKHLHLSKRVQVDGWTLQLLTLPAVSARRHQKRRSDES
ncbi:hypothetical protein [Deinococcus sp.]|uniref:hypothetical protein n=1 Tax=Deinococcus sp. TaxID=47478 RepID=UPI0025EB7C73|nr:hypothetical protein [Deinococcus sp.]